MLLLVQIVLVLYTVGYSVADGVDGNRKLTNTRDETFENLISWLQRLETTVHAHEVALKQKDQRIAQLEIELDVVKQETFPNKPSDDHTGKDASPLEAERTRTKRGAFGLPVSNPCEDANPWFGNERTRTKRGAFGIPMSNPCDDANPWIGNERTRTKRGAFGIPMSNPCEDANPWIGNERTRTKRGAFGIPMSNPCEDANPWIGNERTRTKRGAFGIPMSNPCEDANPWSENESTRTKRGAFGIPMSNPCEDSGILSKRTDPARVAFSAYLSQSRVAHIHEVIVYDQEMVDTSEAYNAGDGIFTVPSTGVYAFTWTLTTTSNEDLYASVKINGANEGVVNVDTEHLDIYGSGTGLIVKQVNRGDHVFIRAETKGILPANPIFYRSTFSGWRLF